MCVGAPPPPTMDCTVVDAQTGRLYDLTPLAHHAPWAVADNSAANASYSLAVCGTLIDSCGTASSSSACARTGTNAISLGAGGRPQLTTGVLSMQYTMVRLCLLVCVCLRVCLDD